MSLRCRYVARFNLNFMVAAQSIKVIHARQLERLNFRPGLLGPCIVIPQNGRGELIKSDVKKDNVS